MKLKIGLFKQASSIHKLFNNIMIPYKKLKMRNIRNSKTFKNSVIYSKILKNIVLKLQTSIYFYDPIFLQNFWNKAKFNVQKRVSRGKRLTYNKK